MKKLASLLLLCSPLALPANADSTTDSFCHHRYESFRACPVDSSSIVFIGNSITNMGSWAEFFGGDSRIRNRGNSGTDSNEWLDDIETVLAGKPASVFIMIGTNDIGRETGTPESVARNFRRWAERTAAESPRTKLYCVSTFPSTIGRRNVENHAEINRRLREVCNETSAEFIDLWDDMQGILDLSISKDRLHLNAAGYRKWIDGLLPYLPADLEVTLPEGLDNAALDPFMAGQPTTYGKRISLFSALPVGKDDCLLVGDEYLNGGEWSELLSNPHVKNRASAWGNDANQLRSFENWRQALPAILTSPNAPKASPARIMIGIGRAPALKRVAPEDYRREILSIVEVAKNNAAGSEISLLANLPVHNDTVQALTVAYNAVLRQIADSLCLGYTDLHTPLCLPDGKADPAAIDNTKDYVTALGYNRIARTLAQDIPGCRVTPEADFLTAYNLLTARRELGRLIEKTSGKDASPGPDARKAMETALKALRNGVTEAEIKEIASRFPTE